MAVNEKPEWIKRLEASANIAPEPRATMLHLLRESEMSDAARLLWVIQFESAGSLDKAHRRVKLAVGIVGGLVVFVLALCFRATSQGALFGSCRLHGGRLSSC